MKIIRQGKTPEELRVRVVFECYHCNCKFEADDTEYAHDINQHDGETYSSCCPNCGHNLNEKNICKIDEKDTSLIDKIYWIIVNEGQHDLKFKLDEIIRYDPAEIKEILLKHKDELQ